MGLNFGLALGQTMQAIHMPGLALGYQLQQCGTYEIRLISMVP
jgi:hypothetical protein